MTPSPYTNLPKIDLRILLHDNVCRAAEAKLERSIESLIPSNLTYNTTFDGPLSEADAEAVKSLISLLRAKASKIEDILTALQAPDQDGPHPKTHRGGIDT